jgi:translation elongation factor EF-G
MFSGSSKNFCVVGPQNHGKTTLCDHMLAFGKFFVKENAGFIRFLDSRGDEADLGYSIQNNAATVRHRGLILNLIDSPGIIISIIIIIIIIVRSKLIFFSLRRPH